MLSELLSIMENAGQRMKEFYNSDKDVSYKSEIDLVTQYDVALEKELTAAFNKAFPDFCVIGEESSPVDIGLQPGKVIYLDPIDGTTSFVHRFPFTCISAGVYVDKEPYCAVVCAPVLGETYTAEKGKGAFMNGKPIHVSQTSLAVRSLVCTGFPYDRELRKKVMPLFNHIVDISQGVRRSGSAALDLCYVARGSFDMYYEMDLKPWDMAAGILIVQEAGGKVTNIKGGEFNLDLSMLVASNGNVHDEFLMEIAKINNIEGSI